jgi:hypothetical protein
MGANGRLNNKKVTLRGMVNKEKRELWGIKKMDKRYELK